MIDRRLSQLRKALTRAPFEPSAWIEGLEAFAAMTNCRIGQMLSWSPDVGAAMVCSSTDVPETLDLWLQLGGDRRDVNPIVAQAERTRLLEPFPDSDVITRDERKRHCLWQEFYERLDMPHVATTLITNDGADRFVLSAIRSGAQGPFDGRDLALIEEVSSSWRRAVLTARVLGDNASQLLKGGLDTADVCAAILDVFGHVQCVTTAMEEIVRRGLMSIRLRRLTCKRAAAARSLEAAIGACRLTGRSQHVDLVVTDANLLNATVAPLPEGGAFGPSYVAIFKPARRLPELTPAEREVAEALLRGDSLME